jgi:large subunit ribosomal protein MRP49
VVGGAILTRTEGDRKEVIDCQNKHENDIVKALLELTNAKQLPINERDSILANEYLQEKERQERALAAKMAKRAAKKEEERLENA